MVVYGGVIYGGLSFFGAAAPHQAIILETVAKKVIRGYWKKYYIRSIAGESPQRRLL